MAGRFFWQSPFKCRVFFLQASLGRSSKGRKLSGSQIKLVNQVNLLNCGAQDQEKFGVKLSMRGGCPGRLAQWRWSLVFDHFHHPGHHHRPLDLLFLGILTKHCFFSDQTAAAIALRSMLLSCILCFFGISYLTIFRAPCQIAKYPDILFYRAGVYWIYILSIHPGCLKGNFQYIPALGKRMAIHCLQSGWIGKYAPLGPQAISRASGCKVPMGAYFPIHPDSRQCIAILFSRAGVYWKLPWGVLTVYKFNTLPL